MGDSSPHIVHVLVVAILSPTKDERRIVLDRWSWAIRIGQFGKLMFQHVTFVSLGEAAFRMLPRLLIDTSQQTLHFHVGIPDIENCLLTDFGQVLMVGPYAPQSRVAGVILAESVWRNASTELAASFTSHSQGAGSDSSRSSASKTTRRSRAA